MPDFKHASILEGVRFTAQVAVPNLIQGLLRRRRIATAAASKTGADGFAVSFMRGLRRSYGDGPLWIRVGTSEALLLLGRESIRHALERSPDPFAADPEPKKSAMSNFQPDALTISRNPVWEDRRRFTEFVLDAGTRSCAQRFEAIAAEEARSLSEALDWEGWNGAVRRATRRIVLGEAAASDEELSLMLAELMDKSNPPGRGDGELFSRYSEKLERYVEAGEEGSLVALFDEAPSSAQTRPAGQVTHWLFALGDTLAINALRCLALLATHPDELARVREDPERLPACLHEAMRLWPTTPMLSREVVRETDWDGVSVPGGTQLLIVNTFNHRDRDQHRFADRFEPEAWLDGNATNDWAFNHFSHGPQGCPGVELAMLVGKAMIATLLGERGVRLLEPSIDPAAPLPYSLDYFSLRFSLPHL